MRTNYSHFPSNHLYLLTNGFDVKTNRFHLSVYCPDILQDSVQVCNNVSHVLAYIKDVRFGALERNKRLFCT